MSKGEEYAHPEETVSIDAISVSAPLPEASPPTSHPPLHTHKGGGGGG